jgi:hypothetical protein
MVKFLFLFSTVFLALTIQIFAQTAAEIEALLSSEALNYEQAASFVLRAADVPASSATYTHAAGQKWLSAKTAADGNAVLNEVSLLIMGAFDIQGGIIYSLTKNPRYAYRELVHLGVIQDRADPGLPVSGELLVFMVGKVLDRIEGEE